MKKYTIDCIKFKGPIETDDNDIITDVTPICKVFIGQPLKNLKKWVVKKFGSYEITEL